MADTQTLSPQETIEQKADAFIARIRAHDDVSEKSGAVVDNIDPVDSATLDYLIAHGKIIPLSSEQLAVDVRDQLLRSSQSISDGPSPIYVVPGVGDGKQRSEDIFLNVRSPDGKVTAYRNFTLVTEGDHNYDADYYRKNLMSSDADIAASPSLVRVETYIPLHPEQKKNIQELEAYIVNLSLENGIKAPQVYVNSQAFGETATGSSKNAMALQSKEGNSYLYLSRNVIEDALVSQQSMSDLKHSIAEEIERIKQGRTSPEAVVADRTEAAEIRNISNKTGIHGLVPLETYAQSQFSTTDSVSGVSGLASIHNQEEKKRFESIKNSIREQSQRMGLGEIPVFVAPEKISDGLALYVEKGRHVIVVSPHLLQTGIGSDFGEREAKAVIGHELTHVMHDDGAPVNAAAAAKNDAVSRDHELKADLGGAGPLGSHDPKALEAALAGMLLTDHVKKSLGQLSKDARADDPDHPAVLERIKALKDEDALMKHYEQTHTVTTDAERRVENDVVIKQVLKDMQGKVAPDQVPKPNPSASANPSSDPSPQHDTSLDSKLSPETLALISAASRGLPSQPAVAAAAAGAPPQTPGSPGSQTRSLI